MASNSVGFSSLQLQFSTRRSSKEVISSPYSRRPVLPRISASPSERTSPATRRANFPETSNLPIREIPGSHGLPLIGPFRDRLDYFYHQGRDEYFKTRIRKYQSTVFRTNMPPGPFLSSNPNVVALLDGKSFPILFDVRKVEKKDLFTGTYMPSTELTGGYRMLSYLDPTEPRHGKLKQLMFFLLKSSRDRVIPQFHSSFTELFQTLEREISINGKANFGEANDQAAFNFLARALFGSNPADTNLGLDGPKLIGKWVLFQLSPLLILGLPKFAEELAIHTFPLPPKLVKKDYQRLYDFFYESSTLVLNEAERIGVGRDEACHNLLFATCFNSFGGMKIFFPNMLKWIGRAGFNLHTRLALEIRSAVRSNGGEVTMAAMEQMPLMKSVVYEALRIEPPVPLQYARAKRDMVIGSHDAAFQVREGEMLFGYQPFATKDPKIFDRAEEFVPERFVGEEGERMLKHVLWSNGPETERSTVGNKQCAGKDFVVLVSRLLVVELFLRYDSFDIEVARSPLGASVTLTSLKKPLSECRRLLPPTPQAPLLGCFGLIRMGMIVVGVFWIRILLLNGVILEIQKEEGLA
ncbi:Hydroperoxide dehydratase [Bertholletia excelsa]